MAHLLTTVLLPEDLDFDSADYTVHVKHLGRWVRASTATTLSRAEDMADTAHRRSNLPVEVRDALGVVVLAYEPPCHSALAAQSGLHLV
jgi:hypothetical protein